MRQRFICSPVRLISLTNFGQHAIVFACSQRFSSSVAECGRLEAGFYQGAAQFTRRSNVLVGSTVSIQLAVSLPVVVDVEGRQARGVTQALGCDSISFVTDCHCRPGTAVTVVLLYSQNVAYMPL